GGRGGGQGGRGHGPALPGGAGHGHRGRGVVLLRGAGQGVGRGPRRRVLGGLYGAGRRRELGRLRLLLRLWSASEATEGETDSNCEQGVADEKDSNGEGLAGDDLAEAVHLTAGEGG